MRKASEMVTMKTNAVAAALLVREGDVNIQRLIDKIEEHIIAAAKIGKRVLTLDNLHQYEELQIREESAYRVPEFTSLQRVLVKVLKDNGYTAIIDKTVSTGGGLGYMDDEPTPRNHYFIKVTW